MNTRNKFTKVVFLFPWKAFSKVNLMVIVSWVWAAKENFISTKNHLLKGINFKMFISYNSTNLGCIG